VTERSYVASSEDRHLVDAIEAQVAPRKGAQLAIIGKHLKLSTEGLEAYFFAEWKPVLVDLLVVAAVAEFCDVTVRRPSKGWARAFDVRVAVHEPSLWNSKPVQSALEDALAFVTGDRWSFDFTARVRPEREVTKRFLDLGTNVHVIMPYSDGLDSRAVAALIADTDRSGLVPVRLGTKGEDNRRGRAFTTVPYQVHVEKGKRAEASARSRGFKFAVITGIAAQLANVRRVVVTESGQGALGPVIAVTGQAYPDYRVRPAFTRRVERLFGALNFQNLVYEFPRIWATKGETLRAANTLTHKPKWDHTRSCWQSSRQVGFQGRRRQCGICAACMLRRLSMHAAGIPEAADTYIWKDLSASDIDAGVVEGFARVTGSQREYAVAGILHLDHLASMADSALHRRVLRRVAIEVADALNEGHDDAERKLLGLLDRHRLEWLAFLSSLGTRSFVSKVSLVSPWH
jgi:7-cyano-7-deazaguanine synthase in queuosine biosynthesis